jgi:uncharacterized protein
MKITKNLIKKIEAEAKEYFKKASGCHDWTHVERVRALALKIGRKEKADLGILELAALLHDICKTDELRHRGKFCHAEKGALVGDRILKKYKADKKIRSKVTHCIIAHRYRNEHKPKTIEAKILSDADKLDAIGAVGVARDFVAAGFINTPVLYTGTEEKLAKGNRSRSYTKADTAILEYEVKLKYLKNKMYTRTGKKIANDRHIYMEKFFKRFWQEVRAEK